MRFVAGEECGHVRWSDHLSVFEEVKDDHVLEGTEIQLVSRFATLINMVETNTCAPNVILLDD